MRIAMITPGYLPVPAVKGGAVEVLIEELIKGNEFHKHYEIDLYTVADNNIKNKEYKNTKIIQVSPSKVTKIINSVINKLYQTFKVKKWRTSFCRAMLKTLKTEDYDLIVIHNNLMAYRDIYEKTKNKDNLIYVLHNDINTDDENHIKIAKLIGATAKKILAVSKYTMNQFKQIADTKSIDVFYNCVDLEHYSISISKDAISQKRKEYGIGDNDFVFMYSGRIDIYKGVLEMVKAFKMLDMKRIKLLIVGKSWFDGNDNEDTYTQTLIEHTREIKDRVVFTGFVNPANMPLMYRIADCLVVPSTWEEPFGVVALEGMASKLPLIATNSGGLIEVVNEECAIIVDKEKHLEDNLATAMKKVADNGDIAEKMSKSGFERVTNIKEFDRNNYYSIFCEKLGI